MVRVTLSSSSDFYNYYKKNCKGKKIRKSVTKHTDSLKELQIESNIGIPHFFKKIDSYSLTSNLCLLFHFVGR